jgi:choline dehydrogenase-like flavoprotein
MLIDSRQVEDGTVIRSTVCIIGGGVAGITLVRELGAQGIDCVLLESGGLEPDDATRDLYRGQATGLPYVFADGCRSRYLGGGSNCWGGWCRPLDAWDFERRDWIPHSGWPFGLDELAPYYARTHSLLKLGPDNFDPAWWEAAIGRPDVQRIPLLSGRVRDTISQFSPPARFGKLYRGQLQSSKRIRVFLYANVTGIETDRTGQSVTQVRVKTLTGRKITVTAQHFILAAGGIENPRLMLASNKVHTAGLGNATDLVGRFFMDHPRMATGNIRFSRRWSRNKLYDLKYHYQNSAVSAQGIKIASQFALTPEVLAQEGLCNARISFCSIFHGEGSAGAQALYRCKQAALKKEQPDWSLRRDMLAMMGQPVNTFVYGFTRLFHPRSLIKDVKFQVIVEALPDPQSRVRLSDSRIDRLGMPRVEVNWRLGEQVKRSFDRTLVIVAEELRRSGVAEVALEPPLEGRDWPASLEKEGTWHHMGTTRMHDSPRQGVVDRNCRVHGMHNLYVAGSSVFPTAGANFPTITIAALTLRLADHLKQALAAPDNAVLLRAQPLEPVSDMDVRAPLTTLPVTSVTPLPATGILRSSRE